MTALEQALRDLGAHLEYPPEPDLAARVRARLEAAPRRRRRLRLPARPARRTLAIALAVLLLAAGTVAATPGARHRVLRWLGIEGVRVERISTPPRAPASAALGLGPTTSLDAVRAKVSYAIALPRAGLGPPDEVHLTDYPPGGQVGLVYRTAPGVPRDPHTGVALLLTQFEGGRVERYIEKAAGPGTHIEAVTVNGRPGVFLSGAPHGFLFEDRNGTIREESARLAGPVLVWERGPLTLRLEGRLSTAQALRIARGVR